MSVEPPPDDLFVARLLGRDPRAWEELVARHGGLIASSCRRTLAQAGLPAGEDAVAEASADVIQALLEDRLRRLRRFRSGTPLGAYLRVIARSRTLDLIRSRPSRPPAWLAGAVAGPVDAVEAAVRSAERAERMKGALAALPPRDAEALRLFHLEGLSYRGIAARLDLPEGQVGMLLSRSRDRLRGLLGEDFLESV